MVARSEASGRVFAHSENAVGQRHQLVPHLRAVAELASGFANNFGAAELAYWAGLWHDLGKFQPAFQAYLANPVGGHGPDHKGAGAVQAANWMQPLALLIAGHHGGLPSVAELKSCWLPERAKSAEVADALRAARLHLPEIDPQRPASFPANFSSKHATELLLRMVFSALVDADFLDTEAHFDAAKSERRDGAPALDELWRRFESDQQAITGKGDSVVNCVRHEVYERCLEAAEQAPGFFRLTVPTGGGKTRSAMAFALRHALAHGKRRVIVAIPFTSIIEQTADVYREIFGDDAVVEHHSALAVDDDRSPEASLWMRLATENWDAPIVVTTTVQLFESLFSNRTGRCRKLHNIANSVLVLDEAQTLPARLLDPMLDVMRELVDRYGATIVLSTATQPALDAGAYLTGIGNVREIVPEPGRLFRRLRRVCYEWPRAGEKATWREVADEMRKAHQALAVLNTKADAAALLDELRDPCALHLSTLMCGAHRRDALRRVKELLRNGEPCRLVSTQVIEAGVDVDFPLVLRAIGPLDRIVQAAGRCNREGRLDTGRVVLFDPEGGKLPPGEYTTGAQTTAGLLRSPNFDFDDPAVYEEYFRLLYQGVDLDAERIQAARESFNYPAVGERFRMIRDDTEPVVVRPEGHAAHVDQLLAALRSRSVQKARWVMRRLQPYLVNVHVRLVPTYREQGLIRDVMPDLWEWHGRYDSVRGLVAEHVQAADVLG